MSIADERGALGKRFHDLPTTPDSPDLAWEAMAANVLPPTPPEEEPDKIRPIIWWWFAGAMGLLLIGLSVWANEEHTPEDDRSTREVVVESIETSDEADASVTTNTLPGKKDNASSLAELPAVKEAAPQSGPDQPGLTQAVKKSPPVVRSEASASEQMPPEMLSGNAREEVLGFAAAEDREESPKPASRAEARSPQQLPQLAIGALAVEDPALSAMVSPEAKEQEGKSAASLSVMVGGAGFQSRYTESATWLQDEANELSPELSLRYTRPVGKKLFISTGVEFRNYRFRTAFENVDTDARIYQPGTVDTIFRNLITGEERIVTTDTVGGTRTLRFGNDNSVLELGVPLMIGRRWSLGRHDFSLAAGPRIGLVLARTGRTVTAPNLITDVEAAPQFSRDLNLAGRLEFGYGFQLTPVISLTGNIGAESALNDWAETAELKQRPAVLNGRIGLRFTLK